MKSLSSNGASMSAGNVFDSVHPSGIPYHVYGPHYFWTGSDRLWEHVNRFAPFYPFTASVMCMVEERLEPWPVRRAAIDRYEGTGWQALEGDAPPAANFEEAALRLMPRSLYDRFVSGYTAKQWGVAPASLSPTLAARLRVREDNDICLRHQRYQGLPGGGFTGWVANMLDGIPVYLGMDYGASKRQITARKCLVYTGAIDEFFDFDLGRPALPCAATHPHPLARCFRHCTALRPGELPVGLALLRQVHRVEASAAAGECPSPREHC